ncbi:hypothetical protein [Alcanivorax sp.]|uniref:hypothetical protein n=1 Tax=Alcanivorax sp. TaxID=1872427 RepID=UPI0025BEA649|nr:hypothetical protein [Alcanivorax sp.]
MKALHELAAEDKGLGLCLVALKSGQGATVEESAARVQGYLSALLWHDQITIDDYDLVCNEVAAFAWPGREVQQ